MKRTQGGAAAGWPPGRAGRAPRVGVGWGLAWPGWPGPAGLAVRLSLQHPMNLHCVDVCSEACKANQAQPSRAEQSRAKKARK